MVFLDVQVAGVHYRQMKNMLAALFCWLFPPGSAEELRGADDARRAVFDPPMILSPQRDAYLAGHRFQPW